MLTRLGRRPTATLSIPVSLHHSFFLSFNRPHLDMLVLSSSGRFYRIGQTTAVARAATIRLVIWADCSVRRFGYHGNISSNLLSRCSNCTGLHPPSWRLSILRKLALGDVSFNRTFLKLIMGEEVTRSVDTLMVRRQELKVTSCPVDVEFQDVDPALASSLRRIQQYANTQAEIKADLTLVCLFGIVINLYAT